MVIPKEQGLPVGEEEDPPETADMKQKRDWIISELDQMFVTYGNPTPRNSVEVEAHLYNASKTKTGMGFHVQYAVLARRMLRTILNMAREQNPQEAILQDGLPNGAEVNNGLFDSRSFSLPSTPSVTDEAVEPATYEGASRGISDGQERHGISVIVANPGQTVRPVLPTPHRIDYGFVRLPINGAFITFPQTRLAKRKRFGSGDAEASTSSNAEGAEVVTRVACLEDGLTNMALTSAGRTYEATMIFLVPEGHMLKKINVTLEKNSA